VDEGEGELRREQPGQGAKPGEDADSARGAAAILVARAGEERGRGELRGAREGGLGQYQGHAGGLGRARPSGWDRWPRRRTDATRRRGARRREVGDGVEGNFIINSKFKIQICKLNFSPSSWPQMKKC